VAILNTQSMTIRKFGVPVANRQVVGPGRQSETTILTGMQGLLRQPRLPMPATNVRIANYKQPKKQVRSRTSE